jgi:methylenetetrahydrofolate dehydrogenase (NADP+)/methenyltetrahydrofolate cyclohydrolase/formyltetrahydrofolate synthetase
MRKDISLRIKAVQAQFPRFAPHLAIIQQGSRSDSSTYVKMKLKAAAEAGIKCTFVVMGGEEEGIGEDEVMAQVERLNEDDSVHGVIVQLPLSDSIGRAGERRITEAVSPVKDVDGLVYPFFRLAEFGCPSDAFFSLPSPPFFLSCQKKISFHAYNIGLLSSRASSPLFSPCTPAGVMILLEKTGVDLAGKHAVVLGRSDIVGSPVCALLRRKDATVTQCHSRTANLAQLVRSYASSG